MIAAGGKRPCRLLLNAIVNGRRETRVTGLGFDPGPAILSSRQRETLILRKAAGARLQKAQIQLKQHAGVSDNRDEHDH